MHKQQGWPQALEYSQAKLIQTLVRASQGVNWSWSQCIKSHHAQTSSGKGLPSHFWTRDNVRSILPGLWRKRTGLLLSGPKSSFQMKVNFAFHLEIKVPESGGRVERHRIHVCLKSSVKFPQSVMIWAAMSSAGVGPLCFLKSTVNAAIYKEILEHFMLPSADKLYGDADFIFQQDLAPAHTAKGTKSWFNDHGVTVLDWPANSSDLNPIENLWGIVKRKMRDTRPNNADELKATVKETWASIHLHYIYIYAFSRRFYPKWLTLHSSYSLTFYQLLLSLGIKPMILALLAPCSTIWATGKQKIITIKRTKDLNYFSLCALYLFNTRVSQFELNYWN